MPAFEFDTSIDGTRSILSASGEVDLDSAPKLTELGEVCLANPAVDTLEIDLSAVTFMDSSAIGSLVSLRNSALAADKSLVLTGISGTVRKLLKITGLDQVFAVTDGPGAEASSQPA
jgi:anti-anti-sigma factor